MRLVGFTEQMSEWLAAADALVHSTGGLTVLEAHVRGCPTISYGWGRGHIRANNAAFRRYGIAEVVAGRRELNQALRARVDVAAGAGHGAQRAAVGRLARARARGVRADWFVPALAAHVPRLASAYGIECRLDSQDRVALTFDDGPHAEGTPAVLEELARAARPRRSSSLASRSRAARAGARDRRRGSRGGGARLPAHAAAAPAVQRAR